MNEEQMIFWWSDFCNACKNEDCNSCQLPEVDPFMHVIITPPSNYIHIYGVK